MNRRDALKSTLAGLLCSLTPMAFARKPLELLPESSPQPKLIYTIDGGSLRDSYFRFYQIGLLEHLDTLENYDGEFTQVPVRYGESEIEIDGVTHMTEFTDFENWVRCGDCWYLADRKYVPEEYWHRPGVWPNR